MIQRRVPTRLELYREALEAVWDAHCYDPDVDTDRNGLAWEHRPDDDYIQRMTDIIEEYVLPLVEKTREP